MEDDAKAKRKEEFERRKAEETAAKDADADADADTASQDGPEKGGESGEANGSGSSNNDDEATLGTSKRPEATMPVENGDGGGKEGQKLSP